MEKIGYVYLTTNLVNGKQYVGQHLHDGFDTKYKGSGHYIMRALKKYGWKNFTCEVICWCSTQEELNYREDNYIKLLNTMLPNGYNLRGGGSNGRHSEESKQKTSQALKGRVSPNKGKKASEETRKKQSDAKKGRVSPNKGKKASEETRKKQSDANKGQIPWNKGRTGVYSEDSLKKMSQAQKGQTPWNKGKTGVYSEESRKNMSEAQRNHPKKSKKVLQFTLGGEFVKEWCSLGEIERVLGFDIGNISRCCNNKPKYKSAYGFIWKHPEKIQSGTSLQTHE